MVKLIKECYQGRKEKKLSMPTKAALHFQEGSSINKEYAVYFCITCFLKIITITQPPKIAVPISQLAS